MIFFQLKPGRPTLFLFLGLCFFLAPAAARAEFTESLEWGLHAGYRVDTLDFNLAGNLAGANPNILSELTWDDLEIYQVGVAGKVAVGNKKVDYLTCIRASLNYGWIQDGRNQDSDYLGDNRTLEFSRTNSLTADDHVWDASIGIGLQRKFHQKRLAIALLGGYSYHEQNLRLTQGRQTISPSPEVIPLGPIAGLDSTYQAGWRGPWAGIDLEFSPFPRFSLLGTFEYHWALYKAEADWNLRQDLAHPLSRRHEASGARGLLFKATGRYFLTGRWALDLSASYQDWEAKNGTDTIYFADGSTTAVKLNQVHWQSSTAALALVYRFLLLPARSIFPNPAETKSAGAG